jgi:hypothetical protein
MSVPHGAARYSHQYDLRKFGFGETVSAMAELLCILVCVSPDQMKRGRLCRPALAGDAVGVGFISVVHGAAHRPHRMKPV